MWGHIAEACIAVFIAFCCIVVFVLPLVALFKPSLFKWDERNPYRRHCKKCGQQQDVENDGWRDYWVDMYNVADENCACHAYTKG